MLGLSNEDATMVGVLFIAFVNLVFFLEMLYRLGECLVSDRIWRARCKRVKQQLDRAERETSKPELVQVHNTVN